MSIGENIKQLRIEKEMSQKELADRVGISQSMVTQIERGTKVPALPTGKTIADILECSIEKFFDDKS